MEENRVVKIKLDGGRMPTKGSEYAAAYDVYVPESVVLRRGRQVIDLKFAMELPTLCAAIIQTRSGLAIKGMEVIKTLRWGWMFLSLFGLGSRMGRIDADVIVGLIDEDYRGHTGVIIKSRYWSPFFRAVIPAGTRIAQMRIVSVPATEIVETESLDMSKNRGGGYGHTGTR